MHYWNKSNFEGLLELGQEFEKTESLTELAEYCFLREKGLRRKALSNLDDFLRSVSSLDIETLRHLVWVILSANARVAEAHQFMTYPLLTRLIYPTLDKWALDDPSAIDPLRWLGLLRSDNEVKGGFVPRSKRCSEARDI